MIPASVSNMYKTSLWGKRNNLFDKGIWHNTTFLVFSNTYSMWAQWSCIIDQCTVHNSRLELHSPLSVGTRLLMWDLQFQQVLSRYCLSKPSLSEGSPEESNAATARSRDLWFLYCTVSQGGGLGTSTIIKLSLQCSRCLLPSEGDRTPDTHWVAAMSWEENEETQE